ncbi:MAG: phenylalanine--tRNA ligase subunit beta [bacterium]
MKVSLNWINRYTEWKGKVETDQLVRRLISSVVEVDGIEDRGKQLEKVVVGKINHIKDHPDADKLKVALVDVGEGKELQIVCGGNNLFEGMLVAVALPGAKVKWHGQGEWTILDKVVLRGVESNGMICASEELELETVIPTPGHGVMNLSHLAVTTGTPLSIALGLDDIVLDIENKSLTHRPDLWGQYGLAREVSVLFGLELRPLPLEDLPKASEQPLKATIKAKEGCGRYQAIRVKGVKAIASPDWLTRPLAAVGIRSINAIVDVTNFVMIETGQPIHAFDSRAVDDFLTVRYGNDGETVTTLDGVTRSLDSETLVIADDKQPIAIAGIMGGLESGVTETTDGIIIESANFDPTIIRLASQRLGLRTDASVRFEKSLDPQLTTVALRRAVNLLHKIFPDLSISPVVDVWSNKPKAIHPIKISCKWISTMIGIAVEREAIIAILGRLGFEVKGKGDSLQVIPPSWRATKDVSIKEDVLEEVARHYGFERIQPVLPKLQVYPTPHEPMTKMIDDIKKLLALRYGCTELRQYSFADLELAKLFGFQPQEHWKIANPLSPEQKALRVSLVPGITRFVVDELAGSDHLAVFEIGRVYRHPEKPLEGVHPVPAQPYQLCVVLAGEDERILFKLKGIVDGLTEDLHRPVGFFPAVAYRQWQHPNRSMKIVPASNQKTQIGFLAEIHPLVAHELKLAPKARIAIAVIHLEKLLESKEIGIEYRPLPAFPPVKRDLAVVVPTDVAYEQMLQVVEDSSKLLQLVELFDVYSLNDKEKSLAFHLTFLSKDRTLTAEEVEEELEKMTKALLKLGGKVRE